MNKKKLAYIIPILLAFISVFSLSINVIFSDKASLKQMVLEEINGVGLDKTIILIALIFMFVKTWNIFVRLSRWITHLLAFVFSCFMLIGLSYSKLGNWILFLEISANLLLRLWLVPDFLFCLIFV